MQAAQVVGQKKGYEMEGERAVGAWPSAEVQGPGFANLQALTSTCTYAFSAVATRATGLLYRGGMPSITIDDPSSTTTSSLMPREASSAAIMAAVDMQGMNRTCKA